MKTSAATELKTKSSRFLESVVERLSNNNGVRRKLPLNGRLHIDRQLPFLCVYRIPHNRDDKGTSQLVIGEASYLIAPADKSINESLSNLVLKIVKTLSPKFRHQNSGFTLSGTQHEACKDITAEFAGFSNLLVVTQSH